MRLRRTLRNINWEHVEHAVRVGREGETGDSATLAAGLELTVDYDTLRIGPEGAVPAVAWTAGYGSHPAGGSRRHRARPAAGG